MTTSYSEPARKTQQKAMSLSEAIALFESLPEVEPEEMIGCWVGEEFPTGHKMDGILKRYGWRGKHFYSLDDVHPLVFEATLFGTLRLAPRRVFFGLSLPRAIIASPLIANLFRLLMPVFMTTRAQARLRVTRYLNRTTATMIYDGLPIRDAFVWLDSDTLLGAMERKGDSTPFFFLLRRAKEL
ncbi:GXWXG domain-containing protein [Litorivivens sp.]|uniref:GXWXG domain-containing protein n=1 Tax=Litorivivens sp. TaxID=2020868 RepID=UPI0035644CCB